jgi:hypothetical protein
MNENKSISVTLGNLKNLKWWQATIMIVSITLALGYAASQGANVSLSVSLEARIADLEIEMNRTQVELNLTKGMLEIEVNSSLSGLQKEADYIVCMVDAYACLQNGTKGSLDYYSTNLTKVEEFANGNLTSGGGLIWLKGVQWNTSITLGNNVLVIESYQGKLQCFSNQGKGFLLSQLASDPSTSGWGTVQQGFMWYNTVAQQYKWWNGTAIVAIGSGGTTGPAGPAGTVNGLDFSYMLFNNATSNYMVNGTDGSIPYSSTNASQIINFANGNETAGGQTILKGAFVLSNPILYEQGYGEGNSTVIHWTLEGVDGASLTQNTAGKSGLKTSGTCTTITSKWRAQ